jgi:hypothetical protein
LQGSYFRCVRWDFDFGSGASHRRELFTAARAARKVQLVLRQLLAFERSFPIRGENVRRGTIAHGGVAHKAPPEEAVHRLVVIPRSHDPILLR